MIFLQYRIESRSRGIQIGLAEFGELTQNGDAMRCTRRQSREN